MRGAALVLILFLLADPVVGGSRSRRSSRLSRDGHPVAVLVYHHFVTDEEARRNPRCLDDLTISATQFREQLELFKRRGATAITLEELGLHIRGEKLAPVRSYAIVIDDGYESIYRVAWPILKAYGLPAAVALMVRASDNPAEWARRYPGSTPHLTWEQIDEMLRPVHEGGVPRVLMSIESHTFDHHENLRQAESKSFRSELPRFHDEILADLVKARDTIRAKTKGRCGASYLVWPHGITSSTLMEIARRAGHVGTFAGLGSGAWPRSTDPMSIPRIHAGTGVRGLRSLENALESASWR